MDLHGSQPKISELQNSERWLYTKQKQVHNTKKDNKLATMVGFSYRFQTATQWVFCCSWYDIIYSSTTAKTAFSDRQNQETPILGKMCINLKVSNILTLEGFMKQQAVNRKIAIELSRNS